MKNARHALSIALCVFMLFVIADRVASLRNLHGLLPPHWENSISCDGPDVGVWGLCGPFKALQFAKQALVVTCVVGTLWCSLSFLQPLRTSHPRRTLLLSMGVSLVAYLAWTFSVVVPSVTLAMRTYGAYWLLPQPHAATESAGPWLAMWRHYWAMCGVSLCLLVRGTLSAFEVYRRS